jgi:anti-anti-sigma factor
VSVVLFGELDLASAPELRNHLYWSISGGVVHMVLDLANLTFINSTGISLLVTALRKMETAGGSLVVRNASHDAFKVFEIAGLVDYLSATGVEEIADVVPVTSARRGEQFFVVRQLASGPHPNRSSGHHG